MLDSDELKAFILTELSTDTSYGLLLDLFYRILKEYGIPYTRIRAARMREIQLNLWDEYRVAVSVFQIRPRIDDRKGIKGKGLKA